MVSVKKKPELANRVLVIVGPTAIGKSDLAFKLATLLNGEIINADSRQIYRFMDIGTAKPSTYQRTTVIHHMLDLINPDQEYSLALFLQDAWTAIENIKGRGRIPIVAGGTGQYVRALIEEWNVPKIAPNRSLRNELEARVALEGGDALYQELMAVDSERANKLDPKNHRRLIRALEVHLNSQNNEDNAVLYGPRHLKFLVVGLTTDRQQLYDRVNNRVDHMIDEGWVGEVQWLINNGYTTDLPSMSSIGYRQIAGHIQDFFPLVDTIEDIKRRTRKFARQQYNWFSLDDHRIQWFESTAEGLELAVEHVREAFSV